MIKVLLNSGHNTRETCFKIKGVSSRYNIEKFVLSRKSHEMLSKLFSPVKYREIEFRNRIFVSPMCQYSAIDGVPNDWHFVHLGSRAVGGAGLVMAEATAVSQEGQISPNDLGIWNNIQAEAFKKITAFISSQGAIPGIQLAHAGRKASTSAPWHGGKLVQKAEGGWETFAPSPLPFSPDYSIPHELTLSEIEELILKFTDAANRAINSGFKVIELHMAHGYLLHEFLSPLSNHRRNEYGGDLAGRMKLPLRVAKAVRDTFPNDFPIFVRISVTDWVDNGWDLPQSIIFAKELKKIGIDLVDCSSGGQVPDAKIPIGIGYQVPFSSAIRKEAGIATGAVGFITNAQQAEKIIGTGSADVVFMAREMLRDPYWPLHAAYELEVDVPWPVQYGRAKK